MISRKEVGVYLDPGVYIYKNSPPPPLIGREIIFDLLDKSFFFILFIQNFQENIHPCLDLKWVLHELWKSNSISDLLFPAHSQKIGYNLNTRFGKIFWKFQ